jgi:hypothetical protein
MQEAKMKKILSVIMIFAFVLLFTPIPRAEASLIVQSCSSLCTYAGPCQETGYAMNPCTGECMPWATVNTMTSQLPMSCVIIWTGPSGEGAPVWMYYALLATVATVGAGIAALEECVSNHPPDWCGFSEGGAGGW